MDNNIIQRATLHEGDKLLKQTIAGACVIEMIAQRPNVYGVYRCASLYHNGQFVTNTDYCDIADVYIDDVYDALVSQHIDALN